MRLLFIFFLLPLFCNSQIKKHPPRPVTYSAGGGVTYTTWNPSDKAAGVTLSGSNLVTTFTSTFSGVRSVASMSGTDKKQFEIKVNAIGAAFGNSSALGIANISESLSAAFSYATVNGWGITLDAGNINSTHSGSYTGVGGGVAVNDIIDVLVDMGAGTISVYVNNVQLSGAALFTGITGTVYAYIGSWLDTSGSFTTNFGATPFTYTFSGFTGLF